MKNKILLLLGMSLIVGAIATLISTTAIAQSDDPPQKTLTIQAFLENMKAHPQNYYILINRTQDEINSLMTGSLGNLVSYFNVPILSSFVDDGRNFLLIEIPTTYEGVRWGLAKTNSYVETYQDSFLDNQSYVYYLANNWRTFNYTIIYPTLQPIYFNDSDLNLAQEKFDTLNTNHDDSLSEKEVVLYFFDKLANRMLNYSSDPINSDYMAVYNEEPIALDFGSRDYCPGFTNTSIYEKEIYNYTDFETGQAASMEEYCLDNSTVNKLACGGMNVEYAAVTCPEGTSCSGGKCSAILGKQKKEGPVSRVIRKVDSAKDDINFYISFKKIWSDLGKLIYGSG